MPESLHVVLVGTPFGDQGRGAGMGAATYELAMCLDEAGHRVSVLSIDESLSEQQCYQIGNINVLKNKPPRTVREMSNALCARFDLLLNRSNRHPMSGRSFSYTQWIAQQLPGLEPFDWIEVPENSLEALDLSPWKDKLLVKHHGNREFGARIGFSQPDPWFRKHFQRLSTLRGSSPSPFHHRLLLQHFPDWNFSFGPVYNTLSRHTMERIQDKKRHHRILIPTILEPLKFRPDFIEPLCDGLVAHNAWHLKMFDRSDAELRQRLEFKVKELNLKTSFFDRMTRFEMLDEMSQAGCVLCVGHWESFSYVIMDAVATGTWVIATEVGAAKELIRDGVNGRIVHSADEFEAALREVCERDPIFHHDQQERRLNLESFVGANGVSDYVGRIRQEIASSKS